MTNLSDTLIHAVTAWDIKQSTRKGYNTYALGQYMLRVDEVVAEVAAGKSVRQALCGAFNDRLLDHLLKSIGEPVS